MTILFSINCYDNKNGANIPFVEAWANYIKNNSKELGNTEFLLANNGFDNTLFDKIAGAINTFHISKNEPLRYNYFFNPGGPVIYDTIFTQRVFEAYNNKYSHIIRIDYDCFPNKCALEKVVKACTEQNIEYITGAHGGRNILIDNCAQVSNIYELYHKRINKYKEYKNKPAQYPFIIPINSGDIVGFSCETIRKSISLYAQHINGDTTFCFDTASLSYTQILAALKLEDPVASILNDAQVRMDGPIQVDMWTVTSSLNPKTLLLCDYGYKKINTKLDNYWNKNKITDELDQEISKGCALIEAPYFHMGQGFLTHIYINPENADISKITDLRTLTHYTTYKILSEQSQSAPPISNIMKNIINSHYSAEEQENINVKVRNAIRDFLRKE